MPAFLEFGEFYRWDNPEVWVAIGLILFIAILWVSGAFKTAFGFLDKKALTIKTDLEEAARLRAEAEAMLADIRQQRDDAEAEGAAMLEEARAEAERLAAEAKVKLEESIARRKALAERRIATAEAQALAEVKAAAADLAAQVAEVVLADRVKGLKSDPQVDHALGQLADRLQ